LDTTTQAKLSFKAQLYRVNSLKECTKRHHGSENVPSQERISAKEELGQRSGLRCNLNKGFPEVNRSFRKGDEDLREKRIYSQTNTHSPSVDPLCNKLAFHHALDSSAVLVIVSSQA
jgi:hypothetical protein